VSWPPSGRPRCPPPCPRFQAFYPLDGPSLRDCQGACLKCAHPRGLHPTNPLQILRLPGLWDRALKGMHRIPTGLPIHPMQGSEGLVHGMSGPRGTFPEGPFRGDRSRIYDVCKSASFRSEAKASIPAITARPSLFARSSTRWRMASIARDLAQSDRAAKRGRGPSRAPPSAGSNRAAVGLTQFTMRHVGNSTPRALRFLLCPG